MFAISFDLNTDATRQAIKGSPAKAYSEIRNCLEGYGFEWSQGSVYVTENEDLVNIFKAVNALKALPWFPASVKNVRVFRVDHGSDFTEFMKRP